MLFRGAVFFFRVCPSPQELRIHSPFGITTFTLSKLEAVKGRKSDFSNIVSISSNVHEWFCVISFAIRFV